MKPKADELLPTRATLLHRLKDWQDQASWQEFFDTYWKLIYGVARQAGLTDAEAQDAVQETLIAVAKHLPGFRYDPAIGSFKTWLLNMTRWRIIAQFRKRPPVAPAQPRSPDSTARTDGIEAVPDPNTPDLNALWEAEWQNNLFQAALDRVKRRIDPEKFQIFDCYVHKEWPPEKVAEYFQVAVGVVYQVKHRVTEALRTEVQRLEKEVT